MKLCTICARGGSKGVPGKNLRPLLGEPLILWSITQARQANIFDYIVVSSDSQEILELTTDYADIVIRRPKELATDESSKIPAITHAVDYCEGVLNEHCDVVVDLDVTSPLRLPEDIIAAVRIQEETECTNVVTGTPAHRSPMFNMVKLKGEVASLVMPSTISRRQDSPLFFDMNASVYVWDRDKFMADPKLFYDDTHFYAMPPERSIDIDSQLDFEIVEMVMRRRCLN